MWFKIKSRTQLKIEVALPLPIFSTKTKCDFTIPNIPNQDFTTKNDRINNNAFMMRHLPRQPIPRDKH